MSRPKLRGCEAMSVDFSVYSAAQLFLLHGQVAAGIYHRTPERAAGADPPGGAGAGQGDLLGRIVDGPTINSDALRATGALSDTSAEGGPDEEEGPNTPGAI